MTCYRIRVCQGRATESFQRRSATITDSSVALLYIIKRRVLVAYKLAEGNKYDSA